MSTKVNAATRLAANQAPSNDAGLKIAKPADGTYEGLQGGYVCTFKAPYASAPDGHIWEFSVNTQTGVRGMNIPATVAVVNGEITINI